MNTITSLLHTIQANQRDDGAFPGVSINDRIEVNNSIFATALIASILPELTATHSEAQNICNRAVSFLASQEHADGLYSYFDRTTEHAAYYPPDLDDTALAMAARHLATPQAFDGSTLARLIHILTECEASEGGPYQTWYIDTIAEPAWHDIDLGVNANISFLLSLLSIELPNLQSLFDTAITTHSFPSRYYHSPLLILFFISRSYTGTNQANAIAYIESLIQENGCFETTTMTAVALCALQAFGADMNRYEKAMKHLRECSVVYTDLLYRERIAGTETTWYANTSVSRTFIALALHRSTLRPTSPSAPDQYQQSVIDSCIAAAGPFADTAQKHLESLLTEPISKDVIMLPKHIAHLINSSIDEGLIRDLTIAHLFGWMGYTLLDAAVDGGVVDLAFAAYSIRTFTETYSSYPFFRSLMLTTEQAFRTEEQQIIPLENNIFSIPRILPLTRPTYEKSIGHILSLYGVLAESGYPSSHPLYRHLHSFFSAFLHARQMHDDSHDYIEDLSRGHLTRVGARILRTFTRRYPMENSYTLPRDSDRFHECFWEDCFPSVYRDINRSIRRARRALRSFPFDTTYFETLITSLERAQANARTERARMQSFLKAY